MNYFLVFVVGSVVGAIVGALIYRNNAKRAEDVAKKAQEELENLKKRVGLK